jgi:hypothetical protein
MDDLDHMVRAHYRAVDAPPALRERLVGLAAERRRTARRWRWLPAAAAALLLAMGSVWRSVQATPAEPPEVAAAVAAHHVHDQPPQIRSHQMHDIVAGLPRLDFTVRLPQRPDLPAWTLRGARYCSLGGSIAAQLSLQDAMGGRHTVYVARALPPLDGLRFATQVDGVSVELWSEDRLAYAWARAAGP